MSAFQAYTGRYEFDGQAFSWRCYATTRVHAMRLPHQTPFPAPSEGSKWIWKPASRHEDEVAWLVDADADDFSQILVQVEALPQARAKRHAATAPQAAA